MAETMMRLSPAQLQQMHERVALKERTRIAEEIMGRATVERTLDNIAAADVLDEIAASLVPAESPKRAPVSVQRADAVQGMVNVALANAAEEVPIGPNAGKPKWVPTREEVEQEMQRLVVPGMEREKFPGWDAVEGDGLAPVRERSDDDDIRRLVR